MPPTLDVSGFPEPLSSFVTRVCLVLGLSRLGGVSGPLSCDVGLSVDETAGGVVWDEGIVSVVVGWPVLTDEFRFPVSPTGA